MENFHLAMRSALKKLAKLVALPECQEIKEPNWSKSPIPRGSIRKDAHGGQEVMKQLADVLILSSTPPTSPPTNQDKCARLDLTSLEDTLYSSAFSPPPPSDDSPGTLVRDGL